MRVLRGNAALIATDRATGQEYVFRLPAPMRLGAPRRVQARFVEESLDRSVVNVVTVGNPVYEVTGRFRFVDRPQEWLDLISMAADQRYSLTYVRDLSRSGDEWQVVVIHPDDAVAVEPDPDRFAFAEYEATVVMRSSQPWGSLLGASDVLFRYHAGAPGLTTTRQSPATSRDRTGILRTAAPGVLRLDWRDGRPYALVEGASENLLARSADMTAGVWGKAGSGTAEETAIPGPIEGTTAVRVSPDPTQTGGVRQSPPGVAVEGRTFRAGIWLRGEGDDIGRQVSLMLRATNVGFGAASATVTLTGEWQRHAPPAWTGQPGMEGVGFRLRTDDVATPAASVLVSNATVEPGPVLTSDIVTGADPATRDRDLVSVGYHHAPGSCAVLEAGIEAGLSATTNGHAWQIGSGTTTSARALQVRARGSTGHILARLGNGSDYVDSIVPLIPLGSEYQRLALLDVQGAEARVRLMQRWREGSGPWVEADGGWSSPLDVSALLAAGWEAPFLTIGNVREGTRAGRLVLSDMVVVRGAGHDIDSLIRRFIGRP